MTEAGAGVIVLVLIVVILVILTIALFIMIRRHGPDNPDPGRNFYGKSLEILNERLAKGEITVEEYDELKRKIKEKNHRI